MQNIGEAFNGGGHYQDEGSWGDLKKEKLSGNQLVEEPYTEEGPTKAHEELQLFTELPGGFTVASGAFGSKSAAYDELRNWGSDIEGYTVYPYDNNGQIEYYIVTRGNY